MGPDGDHAAAQLSDSLRQCAVKLCDRLLKRTLATYIYQISDRLGLGQVHAPVQERAPAELARLGHPGPGSHRQTQHPADDIWPSMTMEFRDVLARETRRTGHRDAHGAVDDSAALRVTNLPEAQTALPQLRRARWMP